MLPPKLEKELQELGPDHRVEVTDDGGFINLVFANFSLGEGFNKPASDLLVRVPRSYPEAGPDMFWVDVSVTLADGRPPQAADAIEGPFAGRQWRRFSWHRAVWNPSIENIHSFLEFIRRRLREKR
jgi:E2/UBC family protein E